MTLPTGPVVDVEHSKWRVAKAGLALCKLLITFGLGALTACGMIGWLRRREEQAAKRKPPRPPLAPV